VGPEVESEAKRERKQERGRERERREREREGLYRCTSGVLRLHRAAVAMGP